MAGKIILNHDEATNTVREINELVENISSAVKVYRDALEAAHSTSDLGFLKEMAITMGKVEENAAKLSTNFEEILTALKRYVQEIEEYSDDTTGAPKL